MHTDLMLIVNKMPVKQRYLEVGQWGTFSADQKLSETRADERIDTGKSESNQEIPFRTARREAYEEIGLPLTDTKLPPPFAIEHLSEFPCQLAMTNLGVRPCVAFLSPSSLANRRSTLSASNPSTSSSPPPSSPIPDIETTLIPRLDAQEVAAVFTAPFHRFLKLTDEDGSPDWYRGQWVDFHATRWKMHNFYVPITRRSVAQARMEVETVDEQERRRGRSGEKSGDEKSTDISAESGNSAEASKGGREGTRVDAQAKPKRDDDRTGYQHQGSTVDRIIHPENKFRVFGMTARILVDAARVAYGEEPEFESNTEFGDEEIIARLLRDGYLAGKKRDGEESVRRLAKM